MPRFVLNPFTGEFDAVTAPGEFRRTGVALVGAINGVNMVFTTPSIFVHASGGDSIAVYYNGQRLFEGAANDYVVSESGGPGTGYDTVTLTFAPKGVPPSNPDIVTADYSEA